METISLVPNTVLNSLYVNERKNCTGGSIVLEDRYTDYFMQVTDTTAVSIDRSLLSVPANCSIRFKLIVWSSKANVLNFSGCSIEQIEVHRGESVFTVEWTGGSNIWTVIPEVLSGYTEVALVAPYVPTTPICKGLAGAVIDKEILGGNYGKKQFDTFSCVEPYALNSGNYVYGEFAYTSSYSAYVWAVKPFMIRDLQIHWGSGWTASSYPSSISVYGSNDGVNWTPIISNAAMTYESLTNQVISVTGSNTFYRSFRFDFAQSSGSSSFYPPISILGYEGSLIENSYFQTLFPIMTSASGGYSLSSNSSAMSSTDGSVYNLLSYNNTDTYSMTRSDGSTNFEITYTLPEAQSICGIYLRGPYYNCFPTLFSIQGSNDGSNWTQIAKLDEAAVYHGSSYQWRDYTYVFDETASYSYYKIIVYTTASTVYFNLACMQLLTKAKAAASSYSTIIPEMASNSQDGYVVSVSSATDSTSAYMMFDGNSSSFCQGSYSDGQWIAHIQLPNATVVRGICIRAKLQADQFYKAPYAFTVQGSNDDDTWTVLSTVNVGSSYWNYVSQLGTFAFENDTAYTYYRLVCTASADASTCGMAELGLMTDGYMPSVDWYEDQYLVPVMSSNSQDGNISSAISEWSSTYAAWKAFDRTSTNAEDCWACSTDDYTDANKECNVWLQIQLATAVAANHLNIVSRTGSDMTGQSPRDFVLKASNDGSDWTTLLTVTNKDTYDSADWDFINTTSYAYYRIDITKTNKANDVVSIGAMNLIHRINHTN